MNDLTYHTITVQFVADDARANELADAIYNLAMGTNLVDNVTVDDPTETTDPDE